MCPPFVVWYTCSVYNLLSFRTKVVCIRQQTLQKEMEHINKALQAFNIPPWAVNTLHNNLTANTTATMDIPTIQQMENNNNSSSRCNNKNISILVPYFHGFGERFKGTCNGLGIQVHFRGTNTIKNLLMAPKDRDHKLQKSAVIYGFKCPHINCPEEYIGESGRSFGDWLKKTSGPNPLYTNTVTPQDTQ